MKNIREDDLHKLNIGRFDEEGRWEISASEGMKIHSNFDLFYRNRLSNETLKKTKYVWDYEFKPQVLETSRQLAAHYRERVLEETAVLIER
jgi:hypothetical protein